MPSKEAEAHQRLVASLDSLHDNERLKWESAYLRGGIAEGLRVRTTRALPGLDPLLLKFHGVYQQDDRDLRAERARRLLEPDYQFMVRLRLPGGCCSLEQWLGLSAIAEHYGVDSLRITTRQTLQIHGVRKPQLQACLRAIGELGLDTRAACGDDTRGVVCGVDPGRSRLQRRVAALAALCSDSLVHRTSAYEELWLGKAEKRTEDEEPLYGPLYLPRKFKVGFAIPPRNDVDILGQDLGFVAIARGDRLEGFTVCVGGGMGKVDGRADSYPRLAEPVGFVAPEEVVDLARTVVGIQRDFGDRMDRHQARFKYTLDRLGLDWFLRELAERRGRPLAPPRDFHFETSADAFGWTQSDDSTWHLGLFIEHGRVRGELKLKLQNLLRQASGELRLTANQNLVLGKVREPDKARIEQLVELCGLGDLARPRLQQRHSLACVGLPTCGLAMAESERIMSAFLADFEALKARHGLREQPIVLRLTGCPNGCARPYLAEIALTGRAPGRYNLYLGGGFHGQRLNRLQGSNLSLDEVLQVLEPLLRRYATERQANEPFGDFLLRQDLLASPSPFRTRPGTGVSHG